MPVVDVLGSTMFYQEAGAGIPVVFLHGNPTSSHLWRKVMPLAGPGRLLAPDLIGMGGSGKPAIEYTLADHARYLDAWFDALHLDRAVLVGHDWGGVLAFDWAARHPGRAAGVVFLETIVRPLAWADFPESAHPFFRSLRTPGVGEAMVLEQNLFIDQALPSGVRTGLADADLAAYREPYPTPQSRRPLLTWARSMPLDGKPEEMVARIEAYDRWLAASPDVPKLLLTFDPGPGIMIGTEMAAWCRRHITALEVAACGPAGHHAPEDQPTAIAAAIAVWADEHGLRGADPAALPGGAGTEGADRS
jgi:haloalkane dehalogenase